MRIVSLLPSTTEILFDLGVGDDVVGVTFECDHPAEARTARDRLDERDAGGPVQRGDRRFVTAAMQRGEDLYHLDEGALAGLDADLVVTQDLCAVCAVDVSVVDDALAHLGCTAEVLTIDPHTLEEVLASVVTLGRATGAEDAAAALVTGAARPHRRRTPRGRRPAAAAGAAAGVDRPAVRARATGSRRWSSRPAACRRSGASASSRGGSTGTRSRASEPDVVVCAPCGFDLAGSTALAEQLLASGELPRACRCGRSTPTRPSRVPGHGWSTGSRRSPGSCTRTSR